LLQDRGLARLGPGAVLGERASLEQGRRTATVRALIGCHIVSYPAAALPAEDLRQLAPAINGKNSSSNSSHRSDAAELLVSQLRLWGGKPL
jgi:CRP-like cAMP-binding protein